MGSIGPSRIKFRDTYPQPLSEAQSSAPDAKESETHSCFPVIPALLETCQAWPRLSLIPPTFGASCRKPSMVVQDLSLAKLNCPQMLRLSMIQTENL